MQSSAATKRLQHVLHYPHQAHVQLGIRLEFEPIDSTVVHRLPTKAIFTIGSLINFQVDESLERERRFIVYPTRFDHPSGTTA